MKSLFATSLYLLITCLTSVDGLTTVIRSLVEFDGFPNGRCISPVKSPAELQPKTLVSLSVIYFELQVKLNLTDGK